MALLLLQADGLTLVGLSLLLIVLVLRHHDVMHWLIRYLALVGAGAAFFVSMHDLSLAKQVLIAHFYLMRLILDLALTIAVGARAFLPISKRERECNLQHMVDFG